MRQRRDGTGMVGAISDFDVVTWVDNIQNKNMAEENQSGICSLENDPSSSHSLTEYMLLIYPESWPQEQLLKEMGLGRFY